MNASLLVCYLRVCVAKVRDAGALTTLGVHTTIGRASDILQGSRISHMYGGLSRNIWARLFYFGPLLRKQVARPNKFKLSVEACRTLQCSQDTGRYWAFIHYRKVDTSVGVIYGRGTRCHFTTTNQGLSRTDAGGPARGSIFHMMGRGPARPVKC